MQKKKKSTDISGWPEWRIPQDFPTLRCASQTHLSGLSESYRAKKAKRFKTRAMDRGLNSLGGILQKESDHCPFLWSSSLLPNLKAAGSEPQPRDKGLFFLAKRSNCDHDVPKQEGSIKTWKGNRATKCQNQCFRICINSARSHAVPASGMHTWLWDNSRSFRELPN